MIEPFYLRWRNLARAIFGGSRPHAREPWMATRPEAHDGGGGEPGSTPLGVDDEAGRAAHEDREGITPLKDLRADRRG